MKMLYDGQEYEVKLARPSKKVIRAVQQWGKDGNGENNGDDDILSSLVMSVDGVPIDDVDDELQWAALFAAMKVFGKFGEKKSGRKKAGPR